MLVIPGEDPLLQGWLATGYHLYSSKAKKNKHLHSSTLQYNSESFARILFKSTCLICKVRTISPVPVGNFWYKRIPLIFPPFCTNLKNKLVGWNFIFKIWRNKWINWPLSSAFILGLQRYKGEPIVILNMDLSLKIAIPCGVFSHTPQ